MHDITRTDHDVATDHTSAAAHEDATSLKSKLLILAAVVIPFAGFIAAMILLWGVAFNWLHLALFASMYAITIIGIGVGYHRLFTHRSFKTSRPVAAILAVFGSMALEGPILHWVAVHRKHHQHSDAEEDPHSPHAHGTGVWGMMRGIWHAHVGWLFHSNPSNLARYVQDLRKEKVILWMHRLFPAWAILGLLLPALLGGLLTMSWSGALLGFIWGGLARVFVVHHVTWSVNSVCHIWGTKPFRCQDESRNNLVFGLLAFGEGWHNNHHAFPTSARHGLHWWQVDVSYLVIRGMALVGLAYDVRTPTPERVLAKRVR